MQLDIQIASQLLSELPCPSVVADFGCGTARLARQLIGGGHRFLNIDLSQHMLQQAFGKDHERVLSVQMNLVEMSALKDDCLDFGMCLFSSIGMIRGKANRLEFLQHVHRALKPRASLLVHVHNRYHRLSDPGSLFWLTKSRLKSWLSRDTEYGDRVYGYRGLPNMYLHIFSWRELTHLFNQAGFIDLQLKPIDSHGEKIRSNGRWLNSWRTGGYFVIARKSG